MGIPSYDYPFRGRVAEIINSGEAQTVIIQGNVGDYYFLDPKFAGDEHPNGNYVSLLDHLRARWGSLAGTILITYETGGPIRFESSCGKKFVQAAWEKHRKREIFDEMLESGGMPNPTGAAEEAKVEFPRNLRTAIGNPAVALRLMEKFCEISRASVEGDPLFKQRIVIILEDADMLMPEGEISKLSDKDRHRTVLCREWFTDPGFMGGEDAVVLIAESASLINGRVSRLPQVLSVSIPSPDLEARQHYITWFNRCRPGSDKIKLWGTQRDLAEYSAGLNLHALRQMLVAATHSKRTLTTADVTVKVEEFIISQLGEGTVEFHRPHHSLDAIVGNRAVLRFLREVVMPRMRSKGPQALSGVAVSGPIGAGKTFIFEGLAAELEMPVLILKNLRSKWYGGTDVILERLERVLHSLSKVAIFVDEADTVFGGVSQDVHETERRLTGRIQGWMSDPRLRSRVIWILMTARVQNLSADIRRPGRVGNLIIPILDPEEDDRVDFIAWVLKNYMALPDKSSEDWQKIDEATAGYSAAQFGALREELDAEVELRRESGKDTILTTSDVIKVLEEQLSADIEVDRRIQTLYALVNCTRKSLLPKGDTLTQAQVKELKGAWLKEARLLEQRIAA